MSQKPHVLCVPGAWHMGSAFTPLTSLLQSAGYSTSTIDLPSVGASPPLTSFDEDVSAVRSALTSLCAQDKDVLLLLHSYGGVVGTQALEGFTKLARRRAGQTGGGVSHVIYCAAFVLPEAASLAGALGGKPLPWFDVSDDGRTVQPLTPETIFYNDLSPAAAAEHVAQLRPHSYGTFSSELTYAGWRDVPCTYLFCTQDLAIPVEVQRGMVEGSGVPFRTETLDAGHSPFLSVPDQVASAVRRSAGETI